MSDVNYGFLSDISTSIDGNINQVVKLFADEKALDERAASDDMIMISGGIQADLRPRFQQQNHMRRDAYDESFDFSASPDSGLGQEAKRYTEQLNDIYKSSIANENMKKYPGMHRFLEYNGKFLESAVNGENRYSYMTRLSGEKYSTGSPDWSYKDKSGRLFSAKEYDDMLVGMKYPEIWDALDSRIDLEMEMDKKPSREYTASEKKGFSDRIKESNNKLISLYEHQMSDASKEKYSEFFYSWDGREGTVAGKRGPRTQIEHMQEENAALDRGWDPTKISDYKRISTLCDRFALNEKTEKQLSDPAFAQTKEYMKRMSELHPRDKSFKNPEEFNAYSRDMMSVMNGLAEEMSKPEVAAATKKIQGNHALQNKDNISYLRSFADKGAENSAQLTVDDYENRVFDIKARAKKRLQNFEENLDGLQKKNSEQYTNMRGALSALANLPDDASLDSVNAALENLSNTSKAYTKKNSGWFKSDAGQKRLDAAADLTDFAANEKDSLKDLVKGSVVEKNSSKSLSEIGIKRTSEQYTFASDKAEKAAGVDNELNRDIQSGMERHQRTEATEKLDQFADKLQGDMEKKFKDGYDTYRHDEFTRDVAKKVVIHTLRQKAKEMDGLGGSVNTWVDRYSGQLMGDDNFKAMMSQMDSPADRKQLVEMEPGEVFAKMAMTQQNRKLQQEARKQKAPEMNKQQPQAGLGAKK